jgi:phosphoketolase
VTTVIGLATLSLADARVLDRYWRAANYLAVGQIYLMDNPLLREPLLPDHIKRDAAGMWQLFRQFSFPGGVPSHVSPETPGSIHEGGELGYSLSHAHGAAFDNPDLVCACVVGDGEAETGPLATLHYQTRPRRTPRQIRRSSSASVAQPRRPGYCAGQPPRQTAWTRN